MAISLDATEYTFQGEGITASFFPNGAGGPILEGKPEIFFFYQDHTVSKSYGPADVDVQQIENVGALVSVVLAAGPVIGTPVTTFTVFVPAIGVAQESSQPFKTTAVTTIQAATLVQRPVFPALQTYHVKHLEGTASVHPVPFVAATA